MRIKLQIGSTKMVLDDKEIEMTAAPEIIGGHTMIPLRAYEEALGREVEWSEGDQSVLISTADEVTPPVPADPVPNWHAVKDPDVSPWRPWNAPITSNLTNRSSELYEAVIMQCGVATAPRYRQGNGNTYCNIFLWDVTRAMEAEIPHWVKQSDRATPSDPDYTYATATELDANSVCVWLENPGGTYGWEEANAARALACANQGKPAVAVWSNPGGIGHVAVVRPGKVDSARGVPTAQAGASNFDTGYLDDGFGHYSGQVRYYIHD